jgi:hypothetical protein
MIDEPEETEDLLVQADQIARDRGYQYVLPTICSRL